MQISLVIPAYNEEDFIGGCLDAVLAAAPGRFHEIVVIDNGSTDRTAEVARARPGVRVVREPEKGLTSARQRGFVESSGDFVAYIDADTRMPPHWFEKAVSILEANPDAVALSGPARYWDATASERAVLAMFWWIAAPITYRVVGYMILGTHVVIRRSALAEIGGFDRKIDFYGEDTDLARRLSGIGRVLFRMDFVIYSSVRRFRAQGLLRTSGIYVLNHFWPAIFGRPFTRTHKDIRSV